MLALQSRLAPRHCRICAPGSLDERVRGALVWKHTGSASRASDVLQLAVPLGVVGALALSGWEAGGARTVGEDLLVGAEAGAAALLATEVAKNAAGRLRPDAWHDPGRGGGTDRFASFWSGHTAATFAAATAAGTIARLRGYRSWPWILGAGLAGAAACGYLRIAADRHWASDVLAGAAAGSLFGAGMPLLLHAPEGGRRSGVDIAILPNGLAGRF